MSNVRLALPSYVTGTVAATSGSPVITGTNTAWTSTDPVTGALNYAIVGGDRFIPPSGAYDIPIRSIDSPTQITLWAPVPNTINAGSAYTVIKYLQNTTGPLANIVQALINMGTDASPVISETIDNGTSRFKLRIASNGDGQLAFGTTGTADSALTTVMDVSASTGAVTFPAGTGGRTAISDANYVMLTTDRLVALTSITVSRTFTLPSASLYPTNTLLRVVDESGAVSPTKTLTVTRAGTDTISGATTAVMAVAYSALEFEGNGASKWTLVANTMAQQNNTAVNIDGGTIDATPIGSNTPSIAAFASAAVLGSVVATGAYGYRHIDAGSTYGVFSYNTGANYYLMVTPSGTPTSTYGSLRPFAINLSTGRANINQGLTLLGGLSVSGGMTADSLDATPIGSNTPSIAAFASAAVLGSVVATGAYGYRHIDAGSTYGVFSYNTGANYYLMVTPSGTPTATFGSLRPFSITLSTGKVAMNQGLGVLGGLSADTLTATTSLSLPSYTVSTLPAAGTAGRTVYCSNARMMTTGGTLQSAGSGTGGVVSDNGTAWQVAGTNITAAA